MQLRNLGSRRQFIIFALGGSSAILAAACVQAPPPTAAPSAATPAAAPPKPAEPAAAKPAEVAPAKPAEAAAPKPAAPTTGAKQANLEYWFWADDQYQATLYTDAIKRFSTKTPNIQVKTDFYSVNGDMKKKLVTSFAAGAGMPDFSHGLDSWITDFSSAAMIMPIEPRLKDWPTYKDWLPNVVELSRAKAGQPVSLLTNQVLVSYLYYRADWLEEAKVKPPDSLDDLLEVAKAITKAPDRAGFGFRGGDGGGFSQQLGHYLKGNGVDIIKEDGTTVDLDSADAVATVDWYVSLYTKHKVTQSGAVTDRFPELVAGLQGNKIGLMHHGIWSWKTQEGALKEKVSAVQIPKGSKRRHVDAFVEGEFVYLSSKQQDEAWQVAASLGELEQARIFSPERGAGPLLKTMLDDKLYKENRFFKAALDSQAAWGRYPSYHKNWSKMTDRYTPEMQRLMKSEITATQFCKTLADTLRNG